MNTCILELLLLQVSSDFSFNSLISILENMLAFGGQNVKTELLNLNDDTWRVISDYPEDPTE